MEINKLEKTINSKCDKIKKTKVICLAPWKRLYIGDDMTIMPECLCRTDILCDDDLWNGKSMSAFRKSMIVESKEKNNNILDRCTTFCYNSKAVGKFWREIKNKDDM